MHEQSHKKRGVAVQFGVPLDEESLRNVSDSFGTVPQTPSILFIYLRKSGL
jgi:hypothetical protein